MRYPDFIEKGETIGICAPSSGVFDDLKNYKKSISILKKEGYKILETESVRNGSPRSNDAKTRAKELDSLITNNKVKTIICAAGGDYMMEILPYINFDNIKNNPKWIMGSSDPTNLLFTVTVNLDIATLYGYNAGSYHNPSTKDESISLKYLKGNIIKQNSYKKYIDFLDSHNNINNKKDVKWIFKKDIDIKGRCIGGCLDVIEKLIGTKYLNINNFINKYKEDGIVWYLDIFSMSSYDFYLSLLKMKYAGLFKNTKAVLVGRVAIQNIQNNISYKKAIDLALPNIPHISEMDIGHSRPRFTMINGAIIHIKTNNGTGSINFELK